MRTALASEDWYQGLSDAERKTVDDAVAAATKANREWVMKAEAKMIEDVKKAGVAVTTLTPDARAEFVQRSRQVYSEGVLSPEQAKLWIEAADKTR
jgi:TRAP-type C4-dicarboxylate transport system substrate-binding protein